MRSPTWPARSGQHGSERLPRTRWRKSRTIYLDKLLANIQWIFDGCPDKEGDKEGKPTTTPTDRMASAQMVEHLVKIEGLRGPNTRVASQSPPALLRNLRRLDILSETIRFGSTTAKGYYHDHFKDAFARHLPSQNVTTSQPNNDGHCYAFQGVTSKEPVASKTHNPITTGIVTLLRFHSRIRLGWRRSTYDGRLRSPLCP